MPHAGSTTKAGIRHPDIIFFSLMLKCQDSCALSVLYTWVQLNFHSTSQCVLIGTNHFLKQFLKEIFGYKRDNNHTLPMLLVKPMHYAQVEDQNTQINWSPLSFDGNTLCNATFAIMVIGH